jgi:hypothetical protein
MKRNLKMLAVMSVLAITLYSCAKQEVSDPSSATADNSLKANGTMAGLSTTTTYIPGTSYKYYVTKDASSFLAIEYIAGDESSRLIIAAPHGGLTQPSFMKTRTDTYDYGTLPYDQYSTDTSFSDIADSKTRELAISIADSIRIKTGKRPHLIINHLHRSKLDANRRREVATQGGIYAGPAWDKFHEYIDAAKATINANHPSGLFIDVHGQAHTPERTEVGYLLTKTQLTTYTSSLGSLTSSSSIKAMVVPGITHTSLIKGTNALGTLLNTQLGYMVTPSSTYPMPGDATIFTDGNYFNGGYNTSRHGSKFDGTISGIQIEFNQGVRLTDSTRPTYAGKIANALNTYLQTYFN